jgi:hypothetical protein
MASYLGGSIVFSSFRVVGMWWALRLCKSKNTPQWLYICISPLYIYTCGKISFELRVVFRYAPYRTLQPCCDVTWRRVLHGVLEYCHLIQKLKTGHTESVGCQRWHEINHATKACSFCVSVGAVTMTFTITGNVIGHTMSKILASTMILVIFSFVLVLRKESILHHCHCKVAKEICCECNKFHLIK